MSKFKFTVHIYLDSGQILTVTDMEKFETTLTDGYIWKQLPVMEGTTHLLTFKPEHVVAVTYEQILGVDWIDNRKL